MRASAPIVTSEDADAFMRKYLAQPTDVTARLVFADWLEETGTPHNRAWAYYIRLKAETNQYEFGSLEREELEHQADEYAPSIRAQLTIPAKLFVGYPKSLLQLLPAPNITVKLADFSPPRTVIEYMPESVARENLVLPLDMQGRVFICAAVEPRSDDTRQKLEFILNRDIVLVGAELGDLLDALDREFDGEFEVVESITYINPPPLLDLSTIDGSPISRLANLIIREAINLHADRILITPEPDGAAVRYRIDDEWVDRDYMPARVLGPVTARLAMLVGIPVEWTSRTPPSLTPWTGLYPLDADGTAFHLRITIQPSPDGPTTQVDLLRDPPPSF